MRVLVIVPRLPPYSYRAALVLRQSLLRSITGRRWQRDYSRQPVCTGTNRAGVFLAPCLMGRCVAISIVGNGRACGDTKRAGAAGAARRLYGGCDIIGLHDGWRSIQKPFSKRLNALGPAVRQRGRARP